MVMGDERDRYEALAEIVDEMGTLGLACTISAGQMYEVCFHPRADKPPLDIYYSLDLLTAVKGARDLIKEEVV